MTRRSGIAAAFLSLSLLALCATAVPAQGLLDTVKGLMSDPRFTNYIRSKVSSVVAPSAQNYQAAPDYYQPGAYGSSAYPSAYTNTPASPGPVPAVVAPPSGAGMTITKRLAPAELLTLSQYDIEVMIDQSGSMSTRDCPDLFTGARISRWDWCRAQSSLFTQQTSGALATGVTLVPFSDRTNRFTNVSPQAINQIFNSTAPRGGTDLAGALRQELQYYFQQRNMGLNRQPLLIGVITDGVPDSKNAVYNVLREAADQISPGEIKIVFFLIGQDDKGLDFVDELNRRLSSGSASPLVLSSHSFAELNQVGLARSLVMAVSNRTRI